MADSCPTGDLPGRYADARRDPALVVLEGIHALKHALRFGARVLDARTRDPDGLARLAARVAPDLQAQLTALVGAVDDATYHELAPSPHPTGVIALARRPAVDVAAALAGLDPAPVVLLDRPTHHGNMGAVVRVAAAAGAAGVLMTGPHDPWRPAAVRGAAGLQFALPVAQVEALPATDRPLVVLDPGGEPLPDVNIPPRAMLVFGSEREGVSDGLLARAALRVAIPMRPGVSSLNLATAVAVTLYAVSLRVEGT
jgi:RNA methyltransferase, TrmH family